MPIKSSIIIRVLERRSKEFEEEEYVRVDFQHCKIKECKVFFEMHPNLRLKSLHNPNVYVIFLIINLLHVTKIVFWQIKNVDMLSKIVYLLKKYA